MLGNLSTAYQFEYGTTTSYDSKASSVFMGHEAPRLGVMAELPSLSPSL